MQISSNTLRMSKSKYMAGLQCHKRLYLDIRHQDLATKSDARTEAIFDEGHKIGRLAHRLFPGGILIEHDREHLTEALEQTARLLRDASVPAIFEATFDFDGVLIQADILKRVGQDRWRLIEVKGSTQAHDHYSDDVAIQTYVVKGAGVDLDGSWLMHVNGQYVHPGGEVDVTEFFTTVNVTDDVNERLATVPSRLAEMRVTLSADTAPPIEPDRHCDAPYHCQFWEHCTKDKPKRWVFYLPRVGQKLEKLNEMGIESIDDIPEEFPLSDHQRLVKEQQEWLDDGLKAALKSVRYPVHHLDFETISWGIPRYAQTHPFQQIPFQWSNHIESADGQVRHDEFLHMEQTDSREVLALSLLKSLRREGSICVYTGFEGRIIRELSAALPKLRKDLDRLLERLWDLYGVVGSHYLHPGFGSSYSLKAVLPALLPSLDYGDLAIQDGNMASNAYVQMLFGSVGAAEQARIKADVLAYCGRDTLAMVELRRMLLAKALQ